MFTDKTKSGIVTVANWTMADDGVTYLYFWCNDWEIVTDKQIPVDGFRSTEKWQLIAIVGGVIRCVIPGCQVKGFVVSELIPATKQCYAFN